MRHLDLFSGIGGFALACKWVWGDEYINVGHSEIEKFPCQVYHRHFPESECLGDITKIQWDKYAGRIDILTGGFPCQPFSAAGKRKGKEDARYLWPAMLEAIREVKPTFIIGENVGGIRGLVDEICTDLEGVGYETKPVIIEAGAIGANIIRERMWFISSTKKDRDYKRENSHNGTESPIRINLVCEYAGGKITARKEYFESNVCRIAYGISNRMDRISALGNAIVPQVAEVILRAIKEFETIKKSEKE